MRCPKCHYLSFEPEPRCRNCGFDLSGDAVDVALKRDEREGPLADLALRPAGEPSPGVAPAPPPQPASIPARAAPVSPFKRPAADLAAARSEPPAPAPPAPPPPAAARVSASSGGTTDLPLFVKGLSIAAAPPPAPNPDLAPPPVAVQRSIPARPRAQQATRPPLPPRKPGPFDGDLLEDLQRIERIERGQPPDPPIVRHAAPAPARAPRATPAGRAEPWRGLLAAAIDATFIGVLNVAILWITLRWTDLAFVDASLLPLLPLGTFFVLVALGYLAMFTAAGGQTVGKMVAGVRVVAAEPGGGDAHPLTVQQALLRSLLAIPSVLLLGLGFLPAVLGSGTSLHDRLAHTRIVRA